MPAATSHEDIYNQTSGSNSLSSSSFCSSASYLPDFMMMFRDPSHQHPLLDRSSCGNLKHINNTHNLKGEQLNSNDQKSSDKNQLKKNHLNCNNLINYQQQQQQHNSPTSNNTYHNQQHHPDHNSYYSPYQSSLDYYHTKISVHYDGDEHDLDYVYADTEDDEVRDETVNYHDDIPYCNAPISMKEISENQSTNNQMYQEIITPHYLTIEELKSARTSCWLCGCNWQQDHVSLDCPECGGYALSRPCPTCDGQCKQMWKRNINGTHDRHKASWVGECTIAGSTPTTTSSISVSDKQQPHKISMACYEKDGESDLMSRSNGNKLNVVANVTIASSVCSSQPSSAASSDSELEFQHDQIQLGNNQKQKPALDQSAPSTSSQSKSQQQQRQYKIGAK